MVVAGLLGGLRDRPGLWASGTHAEHLSTNLPEITLRDLDGV